MTFVGKLKGGWAFPVVTTVPVTVLTCYKHRGLKQKTDVYKSSELKMC